MAVTANIIAIAIAIKTAKAMPDDLIDVMEAEDICDKSTFAAVTHSACARK